MIYPPIPTPFDRQGNLDAEAFRDLAQMLEPHVDGILFYGSNGEGVHLTRAEREKGLALQRPHKPPLVGLMEETLAQGLEALEQAQIVRPRAVLATPPRYYAASLGNEGLEAYFSGLADAGKQVWLYHVPQNTKAELPLSVVANLSRHPNISGLKDSSGELARLAFYQSQSLDLEYFTGHAPTFLGALALGASGGILAASNLAPLAFRKLEEAWRSGNMATANLLQTRLEPLGRVLGQGGVVLLKQAMRYLGLPAGYPRPPYPAESPLWPVFKGILENLKTEGWLVTGD